MRGSDWDAVNPVGIEVENHFRIHLRDVSNVDEGESEVAGIRSRRQNSPAAPRVLCREYLGQCVRRTGNRHNHICVELNGLSPKAYQSRMYWSHPAARV